jgi:nucleotide-binding universal stress UspA family protein
VSPLRHVLVPSDFGEASNAAVLRAVVLSRPFGASITLLHVVGELAAPGPPSRPFALARSSPFDLARQLFIRAAGQLCADYPRAHAVMRRGRPMLEILAGLDDAEADIVIMGAGNHEAPDAASLGGVAEAIVRLATVPVLTVSRRGPAASVPWSDGARLAGNGGGDH